MRCTFIFQSKKMWFLSYTWINCRYNLVSRCKLYVLYLHDTNKFGNWTNKILRVNFTNRKPDRFYNRREVWQIIVQEVVQLSSRVIIVVKFNFSFVIRYLILNSLTVSIISAAQQRGFHHFCIISWLYARFAEHSTYMYFP